MRNPFLVGKIIYLRPLDLDDLKGNYIKWLNDEEVCRNNSYHVFPYSKECAEDYIRNAYSSKDKLPLAIVTKKNDIHIGNISLTDINYINRSSNWGIIIGEKEYWGKGYSKESSFLLLRHAFESLNLHRIHSGTTSENIGGQKLMEAMGMIKEGVRREAMFKNGKFVDIIEYGVLKNEFYNKFGLT